ncbi:hypothetical protein BaRGS_00001978, partial [Batillaria attramentaria]
KPLLHEPWDLHKWHCAIKLLISLQGDITGCEGKTSARAASLPEITHFHRASPAPDPFSSPESGGLVSLCCCRVIVDTAATALTDCTGQTLVLGPRPRSFRLSGVFMHPRFTVLGQFCTCLQVSGPVQAKLVSWVERFYTSYMLGTSRLYCPARRPAGQWTSQCPTTADLCEFDRRDVKLLDALILLAVIRKPSSADSYWAVKGESPLTVTTHNQIIAIDCQPVAGYLAPKLVIVPTDHMVRGPILASGRSDVCKSVSGHCRRSRVWTIYIKPPVMIPATS